MRERLWNIVDKRVCFTGGLICLLFVIFTVAVPKRAESVFSWLLSAFCSDFGWFYLLSVVFFIVFLVGIAFSKYGKIPLGKDGEKPEHSTFSWFFMLFAAGMGIGLVFWSVAEPMSHFLHPPYGEGGTSDAAVLAMRYSFMHWGIHPWACYAIVGLPLAYFQFRKKRPALLSQCVAPVIGETNANGWLGSIIDVLAVFATVFGVATSLGLGAMQINSGLYYVFGVPYHNAVLIGIIAVATVLFITSSVSGIDKGIKILSNSNMALMAILLLFVFFSGSPLFTLNLMVDSFGQYISNFISASFWTDPFGESGGWLNSWTVFYWAWWISWGPFVGGFIARISKGRTIREFILGALVCPMLLSVVFISIMGSNGIAQEMSGVAAVSDGMNENISYALFALLEQFSFSKVTSFIAVVLICVFFITSADSSTFVCSMMTARGVQNPPNSLKVFWGITEGTVAAVLLLVGGLTALQSVAILSAFPMIFICFLLAASILRSLRAETGV